MNVSSHLIAFTVLIAVQAACIPCASAAEDSDSQTTNTAQAESRPSLIISDSKRRAGNSPLSEQLRRLDPKRDRWTTEVFSDAAQQQLKRLSALLVDRNEITVELLAEFADDEIVCASVRPEDLQPVFSSGALEVHRPSGAVQTEGKGLAVFRDEILALLQPFETAKTVRVSFKLFQVSLDGPHPETTAIYQATGMGRSGRIQQNAIWLCRWTSGDGQDAPKLVSLEVEHYEEVALRENRTRIFSDCTQAVLGHNASFQQQLVYGLDHWRGRLEKSWGIEVSGYQGLAVGDVNGDGLDDVYICQPGGLPNRLYVQNADGTASDVSASSGTDWLDRTSSALFVDLDNDGDQDQIVATDSLLLISENNGLGVFQLKTSYYMNSIPRSMCAADYDNDGKLDIYVCFATPGVWSSEIRRSLPLPVHDANNGAPNILYRNEGNWNFKDVTGTVGLDVNNHRFSWAASWEDFDNDGDQDLYVANDFGRNNFYRNDGGRFTDIAADAGIEDSSAGMSVSWGDYNSDGWMDLYVGNMFSAAGNRIAYQRNFQESTETAERRIFERHARGNSLFANAGNGSFHDVSLSAGVTMGRWAWGSLFLDINNDGLDDLFVANGNVTQEKSNDL